MFSKASSIVYNLQVNDQLADISDGVFKDLLQDTKYKTFINVMFYVKS